MQQLHNYFEPLIVLMEVAGVAIILGGAVLSSFWFLRVGAGSQDWSVRYKQYRANLGRGILLGLELLVGADIIATVTAPLTWESVSMLAMIVVIRTFLSFMLETEIEGCWPWQRAARSNEPQDLR